MSKRIYVGNLPFSATDKEVRSMFTQVAPVKSVNVETDKNTGSPRGFAWVEMKNEADIPKTIKTLDHKMFKGQELALKME